MYFVLIVQAILAVLGLILLGKSCTMFYCAIRNILKSSPTVENANAFESNYWNALVVAGLSAFSFIVMISLSLL